MYLICRVEVAVHGVLKAHPGLPLRLAAIELLDPNHTTRIPEATPPLDRAARLAAVYVFPVNSRRISFSPRSLAGAPQEKTERRSVNDWCIMVQGVGVSASVRVMFAPQRVAARVDRSAAGRDIPSLSA